MHHSRWFGALAAVGIGVVCVAAAEAQQPRYDPTKVERPTVQAVRTSGPIALDGVLDEPAWERAPVAKNFIQSDPSEGQPAVEQTEVRILYDDDAIYLGAFNRDSRPDKIVVNDLKKDWNPSASDYFAMVFDTFHDRRNCYNLAVNPMGAKWDAQITNNDRETNVNWDGIWDVRTQIVADGWYAEIRIPFQTLRSPEADPQTWGINFMRRTNHNHESSHWAPIGRVFSWHRMSMAGTLEGLVGLHGRHDLRVKPYVLGSGSQKGAGRAIGSGDIGLDIKTGVAKTLTLDLTANTDFSQVEADEQQINLSRFSLFFPEKRDFFLENSGVFQFGPNRNAPGGVQGRQNVITNDVVLFFSRRIGLSNAGDVIPILGGGRLTGRKGRFNIGVLNIQEREKGPVPAINFTALRVRRDVLANSDVGFMLLNKDASGAHFNRVVGVDGNFRFFKNLSMNALLSRSFSPDRVVGAAGGDTAAQGGLNWRDTRWDVRASFVSIGPRFNDEMGFVPRVGIQKEEVQFGVHLRPKAVNGWLRETSPHWVISNVTRSGGGLQSRYVDYHVPFTFQNSTSVEIGFNPSVEDLNAPFILNSRRGIVVAPGRYSFNEFFAGIAGNASAPVSLSGRFGDGSFYDGTRREYQGGVAVRLSAHFNAATTIIHSHVALPAGAFTTVLSTSRLNVSFSTRIFLNALVQYNSDARQWTSNVRFNIIHRPLSDFFLVYNDHRDSRTGQLADRALIAKLTYLVAF